MKKKKKKTGLVYDDRFLEHDTGKGLLYMPEHPVIEGDLHVENHIRIERTKKLLQKTGLLQQLHVMEPRPADLEEILTCHNQEYVDQVKSTCNNGGGLVGPFTPVSESSYEIALLSAGGVLTAIDAVMTGEVDHAFALIRPPGHHAISSTGVGFCIFNNTAIGANYARNKYGLERVMILDWDVHHGNGIQDMFYGDPGILYVSLHQENYFPPGSGLMEEQGEGIGKGFNVNIPLPAGTGDRGYQYVMEQVVAPLADRYQPELIMIAAGQDANSHDPIGRMMVSSKGFRTMMQQVKELADRLCQGRLVLVQEGGYSPTYMPVCTFTVIEELAGFETGFEDPFLISEGERMDPVYSVVSDVKKVNGLD